MFKLIGLCIIFAAIFMFFFALWLMISGAFGLLRAIGQIFRILLGGR